MFRGSSSVEARSVVNLRNVGESTDQLRSTLLQLGNSSSGQKSAVYRFQANQNSRRSARHGVKYMLYCTCMLLQMSMTMSMSHDTYISMYVHVDFFHFLSQK